MTKIVLKHGTGVPSDTDLEVAEVAIDNVSGAMYTKLADDSVKQLNEGGASSWNDLTDKPAEFPPESHTQDWSTITNTPADYPPSAHNHDGVYQPVGDYIEDADSDGKQYARQDGAWSEIVIPEASNTLEGLWVYSSSSATVGSFTTRNANWMTAVTITLHKTDSSGFEHNFALMNGGDIIYLQAPAGGAEYSVVSKSVSGDTCDFIVDHISSYGSFPSDGQSAKVNFIPQVSSGSSVHIGPTPPDTPLEGQQWMEVPANGEATMWIYDGGKWLQQPGGKDGAPGADGNIADGASDGSQDGVIATWNSAYGQWTPDSSLTINSSGNVGIGGAANYSLTVADGVSLYSDATTGTVAAESGKDLILVARSGKGMSFRTGGGASSATRLTIDSTGNATFSGTVTASDMVIFNGTIWRNTGSGIKFNGPVTPTDSLGNNTSGVTDLGSTSAKWKDGHFSGTVNAGGTIVKSQGVYRDGFSGIWFSPNAWSPMSGSGASNDATCNLGASANRFEDAYFSGNVYATNVFRNGSVLTSAKDLIETLHTLREATKDETTIKGLRDAIGNAVGGLIEKFEAMQSTATQEIDSE